MMKLEKKKTISSTIIKQILVIVFFIQLFHIVGVVFIILFNQNDFLVMRHTRHCGNTTSTSPTNHTMALPFTFKSIQRQKKNYENSNISPCKKYNLRKKSSKRDQNPSRYHNFITNLKFQHKPKYHLSKILV